MQVMGSHDYKENMTRGSCGHGIVMESNFSAMSEMCGERHFASHLFLSPLTHVLSSSLAHDSFTHLLSLLPIITENLNPPEGLNP